MIETLYKKEKSKEHISLTEAEKDVIRSITLGIEEVDEIVRSVAVENVIQALENGHPLNRIITNPEGETEGYIACEDFIPHEAYIKYFGTTKRTGRDLLKEIPAFLAYAKQQGYTKLNFHGWNERLNHILERYGFKRLRTDTMGDLSADFYEKILVEQKPQKNIDEERRRAFEEKYLNQLNQEYQKTLATFSEDNRQEKERAITDAFQALSKRLTQYDSFEFGDRQQAILKLKLARHFQNNQTVDLNVLFDAILESPRFIGTDKGSFCRLFEVHEEKTLQKIAEIRKQRAEMRDSGAFNPYENLFTTKSGKYYVARLLNMPHLAEESEYMNHCVGTSDSYVNRIKRGDIEILSFRHVPKINTKTQKLEGDRPIITIEYNLKTKTIEQMKKHDDAYLIPGDPYFDDVIDALKKLRSTTTDTGEKRDFKKISSSELEYIEVADYHILTERGEILFRDFNPDDNTFVFKMGDMQIVPDISQEDAAKIIRIVEGINCKPEEIARKTEDITEVTKIYIGELTKDFFKWLPKNVEHVYTSFPEGKIRFESVQIGGKTSEQLEEELDKTDEKDERLFQLSSYARRMLKNPDFITNKNQEKIELVHLKVRDLGFESGATTDQIYVRAQELGLELCPAEVGPNMRLQYRDQPLGEWFSIAMKPVIVADRDGYPHVFALGRFEGGLWLDARWASPDGGWGPGGGFVFSRSRK